MFQLQVEVAKQKCKNSPPPKSIIGVAISYTLNQWEKLRRYLYSGELGIDNNTTNNLIASPIVNRTIPETTNLLAVLGKKLHFTQGLGCDLDSACVSSG